MASTLIDEEDLTLRCCAPLTSFMRPIDLDDIDAAETGSPFFVWEWSVGPLLVPNESSEARDHCANERTFLSYLRLSVYMAVVSVAITVSFHLSHKPSEIELRMARPLGSIFWALSVATLVIGVGNYIKTVNQYSRKAAIVQSGWRTQTVLGFIAASIVGTCIIFLVIANL